jgi:hypothetical protein
MLGTEHPLARATALVRTFEKQAVAVLPVIATSVAGTVDGLSVAPTVLSASLVVEFALGMALLCARQVRRERAWDIIIAGSEGVDTAEVAREQARLSEPKHREQLAHTLERGLDAAQRWHQIQLASRPPEGVRVLRRFAGEVDEIVAHVRDERADARGIALLAHFLAGSYGSPLYSGDAQAVGHELARIAYLLGSLRHSDRPC